MATTTGRLAATALTLASLACAHVQASGAPPVPPPAPAADAVTVIEQPPVIAPKPLSKPSLEGSTGEGVERILKGSGLNYVTLAPGRQWAIAFANEDRPRLVVHVIRGASYTLVIGRLFRVPDDAGPGFYRNLARRNFDFPQLKIGVDAEDGVFASFEVPNRLVDRDELLEDVFTLAGAVENIRRALGDPQAAPDDPALPPAPPTDRPKLLNPPDGPLLEARL